MSSNTSRMPTSTNTPVSSIECWAPKGSPNVDIFQWICLRDFLQENPIFNGKFDGFRLRFSLEQIHWTFNVTSSNDLNISKANNIGKAMEKQHQGLQTFSNFSSTAASCVAVHSGRAASRVQRPRKVWLWMAMACYYCQSTCFSHKSKHVMILYDYMTMISHWSEYWSQLRDWEVRLLHMLSFICFCCTVTVFLPSENCRAHSLSPCCHLLNRHVVFAKILSGNLTQHHVTLGASSNIKSLCARLRVLYMMLSYQHEMITKFLVWLWTIWFDRKDRQSKPSHHPVWFDLTSRNIQKVYTNRLFCRYLMFLLNFCTALVVAQKSRGMVCESTRSRCLAQRFMYLDVTLNQMHLEFSFLVIHGAISWRPNHEPRFCRPFRCSFQVQQSIAEHCCSQTTNGWEKKWITDGYKKTLSSNPEPERDAQAGPALFESWVNFDDFIMWHFCSAFLQLLRPGQSHRHGLLKLKDCKGFGWALAGGTHCTLSSSQELRGSA